MNKRSIKKRGNPNFGKAGHLGGKATVKKYGSKHMSRIGKKGRLKYLREKNLSVNK